MSKYGDIWTSLVPLLLENILVDIALVVVVVFNPDSSRTAPEVGTNTVTLGPVKQLRLLWVV